MTDLALAIRRTVLTMCSGRGQGYAGQGLALADLMADLYGRAMRPRADGSFTDRFVLSTGHSAIALFATLGVLGVYETDELKTYGMDGSRIEESPLEGVPGFEITGGALGQGLSQALGMALGERMQGRDTTVYCLVSDGELQEGQVWEAAMAAGHHRVGNLVLIVDNNRMQADGATAEVMTVEPVPDKFAAFGFDAVRVDGHDPAALARYVPAGGRIADKPLAIILETIPGRGVPSFEQYRKVHYIRADAATWQKATAELAGS
ncbi:MAG: transketolase [Propionibacteriaceae bacterium]